MQYLHELGNNLNLPLLFEILLRLLTPARWKAPGETLQLSIYVFPHVLDRYTDALHLFKLHSLHEMHLFINVDLYSKRHPSLLATKSRRVTPRISESSLRFTLAFLLQIVILKTPISCICGSQRRRYIWKTQRYYSLHFTFAAWILVTSSIFNEILHQLAVSCLHHRNIGTMYFSCFMYEDITS
jgi:hypothetical protein